MDDPRLENVVVYAVYCGGLTKDTQTLLMLDQLAYTTLAEFPW